jgi:thiamine pyrophosphate-dependent acetolactate synthase large subunit-like protein
MNGASVIARILKQEGVDFLIAYPVNPIIEAAAKENIRTIIVRQERPGLHMADAVSRLSSGRKIGVFALQWGPGAENAFGGVAQAYGDSVPIVVLAGGNSREVLNIPPNFNAALNYRHVTKYVEQIILTKTVPDAMRRAFTQVRNGRPGPALLEIPRDILGDTFPEDTLNYAPTFSTRVAPDLQAVQAAAQVLVKAKRPVLYAGQGIHYAQAWQELRDLAELLAAPVMTSIQGKSAFPENHPLALGSGGRCVPKTVSHFLQNSDVICGIGCSFSKGLCSTIIPQGKVIIHSTLDTLDLNKDIVADYALIGDAKLALGVLISEVKGLLKKPRKEETFSVSGEIAKVKAEWMAEWLPKLTSNETPLNPYRVIWDLMHTVDRTNTIITHDAGSPRDQMTPFWESITPLSYIGWGQTTHLGFGLGLAMGAKLVEPKKLCINVMGDAAIGMTGMDFETAVRERLPILTIVMNNFSMACEIPIMQVSTEKYRSTDISGNYADMAKAFGGYGERVTQPGEIIPAIKRAIKKTEEGVPVLLEFITAKEIAFSMQQTIRQNK